MHDCKETKEQITELVLDGIDDEVLQMELNKCAECRAEFEALNATLRITTRLRETAAPAPAESYWVGYHARLREKIECSARDFDAKAQRRKVDFRFLFATLRLCVRTSVPVPVPLIVAVVLVVAAIVLVTKQPAPQPPAIVHVPVEVPVVQEKIVTRVVYRERRSPARTAKRTSNAEPKVEGTFAKFKPSDEVKLTVIKGGYRR